MIEVVISLKYESLNSANLQDIKSICKKSVVFLCKNNEHTEKKIKKTTLFVIALEKIK